MTPISVSRTGVGRSVVRALDNFTDPFNVGLYYVVTGTATFSLELTPDDPSDGTPTTWLATSALTGLSASGVQQLVIPARGISINITSGTGSVTLYILQAGLR